MSNTAWNGEGLPPVGTVCEFRTNGALGAWERCEVIAHKDALAVCWIHMNKVLTSSGIALRPRKTDEQIAAEEREKAVETMIRIAMTRPDWRGTCEALYDAGYRKQGEQP